MIIIDHMVLKLAACAGVGQNNINGSNKSLQPKIYTYNSPLPGGYKNCYNALNV